MEFGTELCTFIHNCPTPFQFVQHATQILLESGYSKLNEKRDWDQNITKGFVLREERSLIAFNIGGYESGIIVGTHCDSPVLRPTKHFVSQKSKQSCSTKVGEYGWVMSNTWKNRPLRLAGCVFMKGNNRMIPFDSIEPVAIIPNELEDPIYGTSKMTTPLIKYVCDKLNIKKKDIKSHELSFVDANPPKLIGSSKEFLSSQRIDNLTSTFAALKAFLNSKPNKTINVLVVFDFEEVGSDAPTGSRSNFLSRVLHKILSAFNKSEYNAFIAKSLAISNDNGHAVHPNFSSFHDEMHAPKMGEGVVVKKSCCDSFATDMTSSFPVIKAAEIAGVPIQKFIIRNDMKSGTTIGPIISTDLGIATVDLGTPQLAMHSIREIVAVKDVEYNMKLLIELYNHYDDYRIKNH